MVAVVSHEDIIPVYEFPFRLDPGAGDFHVLEQDTDDEVLQSVKVLMLTPVGSRIELLTYGIPEILFRTEIDTAAVLAAIMEHEPRATAVIDEDIDRTDELIRNLAVQITEVNRG